MEENKKKTPQEEAAEIRRNFAKRKKESVELSIKLKTSLDALETALRMEDVDEVNENGLGKMNMHDYIWNILIWYPRQSVPFITKKLIDVYDEARSVVSKPTPFLLWLDRYVTNKHLFRFIVARLPKSYTKDILRYRSIRNCLTSLVRLDAMIEERTDGAPVNVLGLAEMVSYAHVLFPKRTSEFIRWTVELYKECQKVNANQIAGFGAICKEKK